jgi:hypothetical protein
MHLHIENYEYLNRKVTEISSKLDVIFYFPDFKELNYLKSFKEYKCLNGKYINFNICNLNIYILRDSI